MSTDLLSLWDAIQRGNTREIASHIIPSAIPTSAATVCKSLSQDKNEVSPTAGIRTADAGIPRCKSCGAPMHALYESCTQCLTAQVSEYPVTCRARYYDAASRILEEEGQLLSHDNADELGHVIQKWIEETRNNWEPR